MISIIIPAHKEQKNIDFLVRELSGLEKDVPIEIIVALSPESECNMELDLLEKASFLVCNKKGRASQMNEASLMAKGDILTFLHADVKPPKSFLKDIQKTISSGYEAGFFSYTFDKQSIPLKINAYFTSKDGIFTGGGDQCLFIRNETFKELGRFDENQILMEDFELFKRMKELNVKYRIVKSNLVVSARKYECNSYLRVNLSNLLLIILFKMGYSSHKLKTIHDKLIRTPYNA